MSREKVAARADVKADAVSVAAVDEASVVIVRRAQMPSKTERLPQRIRRQMAKMVRKAKQVSNVSRALHVSAASAVAAIAPIVQTAQICV